MDNYEKMRQDFLKTYRGGRRLLLHSCCAPCSTSVLARLIKDFDITIYFYNPNIDTEDEYLRRLAEQKKFLSTAYPNIKLIEEAHQKEDFLVAIQGLEGEKEGGARCARCFTLRLEKLAEKAKALNFDFIMTTLTVSPRKNAEVLNRIGEEVAKKIGVGYLLSDFKKQDGYLESIRLSKEFGLYRQDFCGCEHSRVGKENPQKEFNH